MLNTTVEIHHILSIILIALLCLKVFVFVLIKTLVKKRKRKSNILGSNNKIDIIIAAYNEEKVIIQTINNLLKIEYDDFEIIVIDDGSSDNTLYLLNNHYGNNPKVKILSKKNNGKAEALSYALTFSTAQIVTFIDADTHIQSNALQLISSCFKNSQIAAMSGYLKVRNLCNMLTISQNIEYIALNLEREIFEKINTLTIIPGAICAFRKNQLLKVGGFKSETLTEDCDVTLRFLRASLRIKNEKEIIAFTEAPESLKMFIRQRIRWDYGLMQNLIKHCCQILTMSFKLQLVFAYSWIYRIAYTLLFAVADYFFLIGFLGGKRISYYFIYFLIIDTILFLITAKKEILALKYKLFPFLFYRIIYRHLKLISLVIAISKLIIREKLEWQKITRYNSV